VSVKNIIAAAALSKVTGADFTGSYQLFNATGLPKGICILRIYNNSDVDITISYDGVTDNDIVPTGTVLQINSQANAQPNNNVALFPGGTSVYLKGTADSTGTAYLAAYYQPQGV